MLPNEDYYPERWIHHCVTRQDSLVSRLCANIVSRAPDGMIARIEKLRDELIKHFETLVSRAAVR